MKITKNRLKSGHFYIFGTKRTTKKAHKKCGKWGKIGRFWAKNGYFWVFLTDFC